MLIINLLLITSFLSGCEKKERNKIPPLQEQEKEEKQIECEDGICPPPQEYRQEGDIYGD